MPRIKLSERPSYEFCHSLTVRPTDINYGSHLGNEALLELIHVARTMFLAHLGFNTIDVKNQQAGLILADLAVNYKTEAFAWDVLEIDCQIDELTKKSFRLFHRVRRSEQIVALVETGMVAFDYQARRVVPLPMEFLQALQTYRAGL